MRSRVIPVGPPEQGDLGILPLAALWWFMVGGVAAGGTYVAFQTVPKIIEQTQKVTGSTGRATRVLVWAGAGWAVYQLWKNR